MPAGLLERGIVAIQDYARDENEVLKVTRLFLSEPLEIGRVYK